MKHLYPLLIFCLLPLFLFAQQDSTELKYKYYLTAGVYFPNVTTEIRIDTKESGLGTVLGFENSLDFPDRPVLFRIDGFARISKRSSFTGQFFLMNRNSSKTLDEDVQIGDVTFKAGSALKSKLNNTFYGLTYQYDIFKKPMCRAGFDGGARVVVFDMDFNFKDANGEEVSYSLNLPVPVLLIGLHVNGYFAPRVRGNYTFDFFRLDVDGVKGSVYENKFMLEYYFIKNLSLGIAYNSIIYSLDDFPVNDDFNGKIDFQISGIEAYLSARF